MKTHNLCKKHSIRKGPQIMKTQNVKINPKNTFEDLKIVGSTTMKTHNLLGNFVRSDCSKRPKNINKEHIMSNHVNVNKLTCVHTENQVKFLNYNKLASWPKNNPKDFVKRMPPSVRKVFELYVFDASRYSFLFKKQETIARELGIHRVTVNRAHKFLAKYGIINSIERCNHPNLWKLSSYFQDPKIRTKWSSYISTFHCIFVATSLVVSSSSLAIHKHKQHNYKKMLNSLIETATNTLKKKEIYINYSRNNEEMSDSLNTNHFVSTGKEEPNMKTDRITTPEESTFDANEFRSFLDGFLEKVIPNEKLKAIKEKNDGPLADPKKPHSPFIPNTKTLKKQPEQPSDIQSILSACGFTQQATKLKEKRDRNERQLYEQKNQESFARGPT